MKVISNLVFKGECREAFDFYARVLGGEVTAMFRFGDAPGEAIVGDGWRDRIMHAWMDIGDQSIMGCDAPPAIQQEMGGFSVSVHLTDPAEARRIFDGLAEGGRIATPLEETFWSPAFGLLTDRYGTPWMINTQPAVGWTPRRPQ